MTVEALRLPGGAAPVQLLRGRPSPFRSSSTSRIGWVLGVTAVLLFGALGLGFGVSALHGSGLTPAVFAPSVLDTSPVPAHRLVSAQLGPAPSRGATSVQNPAWLAYDPLDNWFFIAAPPSTLDAVNGSYLSTLQVNATVTVGLDPFGVAVDTATGTVWVTNSGSNTVNVVDPTNFSVIANISVGSDPHGVAYDWGNGCVYVANTGSGTVSVINATTLTVVGTTHVRLGPLGVAVAMESGHAYSHVYVADSESSTVSVLNGSLYGAPSSVIATLPVGDEPYGVAFDNQSGNIYVTNAGSSNISVLADSSYTVVATIPVAGDLVGGPLQGIAYDDDQNRLWAGAGHLYAVVIDPTNETIADYVGTDPSGVTVDWLNGDVCVTNTANFTFECIVFPNEANPSASITFQETGLPSTAVWSVTLAGATESVSAGTSNNITFDGMPFEILGYSVGVVGSAYLATPSSGTVTAGSTSIVDISFASHGTGNLSLVSFAETGLPAEASWWVSMGGVTLGGGAFINFTLPNGTFSFGILPVPGWLPSYAGGVVNVSGTQLVVNISFQSTAPPTAYPVTFYETSIPNGTAIWGVTVNGSYYGTAGSSIVVDLLNGTYPYSVSVSSNYTTNRPTGQVTVAGSPVSVLLGFTLAPRYSISFTETGLPAGANWTVNVSGSAKALSVATIAFDEPNGSYWYKASPAYNSTLDEWFEPSPTNGNFTVAGAPVSKTITYSQITTTYAVTFTETGLPTGSSWTLAVVGVESSFLTTSSQTVDLPNGTFQFSVGGAAGYTASPSTGGFTVDGGPVAVSISFSPTASPPQYSVTLSESGLPNGTGWSASLGGLSGSSVGPTILFWEPNGSYALNVTPVAGYSVNFTTPIVVSGAVAVDVTFSNTTYPTQFAEMGLPTGTLWTVTARNQQSGVLTTGESTGTTVTLQLLDGSYALSANGPAGYRIALSTSSLDVHGASPATLQVSFTSTGPGGATSSAVVFEELTAVYVLTAVIAGVAAAWGLVRYRSDRWKTEGERWVRELQEETRKPDNERPR